MPTLQQTATTLRGAVDHLQVQSVKAGSTRATIGMDELGNSAGTVFNHLSQAEMSERQAVTDLVGTTADAVKLAKARITAAQHAVSSADGKRAAAEATLQLATVQAKHRTAEVAAKAASVHAGFNDKAVTAEDAASAAQAKAEAARDAADEARVSGNDLVSQAAADAQAAITDAEATYDATMTEIENEVRSALGV